MLKRRFRHLSPLDCLSSRSRLLRSHRLASAQTYPSGMIRVVVRHAAGTPPDIMGRLVASRARRNRRLARHRREQARRRSRTIGLAEVLRQPADGYTLASICLPCAAAPRSASQYVRFRLDSDFAPVIKLAIGVSCAGRSSLGASQVARRVRRPAQEPAGQADILLRRLRHAGAPRGRDVQAANRRARHARALSGAAARDCRPAQRDEPVPVHHAAAGDRSDRHRQIARDCRHRTGAAAGLEGCADRRRGGFP